VGLDAAVNGETVSVTRTSELNLRESFVPESEVLRRLVVGWSTSTVVERFTSTGPTISYQREWKHKFPGRVLWFVGTKNLLETSKDFVPGQK